MKIAINKFHLVVLTGAFFSAVNSNAAVVGPFPNGVPGSGYGCDNPCDGGDVNYVIRASIETYTIAGSGKNELFGSNGEDIQTRVRTFTGEGSPFCLDDDGTTGPLAPCLAVNPGQTLKVKLINEMDSGMETFNQSMSGLAEYWNSFEGVEDLGQVTNDFTNLHLHGVQVYPHLFYPEGTGDPSAPWIETIPASVNESHTCFCYVFEIPDDHPKGTFLWHIHRHSSTAVQGWQGMAGYLMIGDADLEGSPLNDLAKNGVNRTIPIATWEWMVDFDKTPSGSAVFEMGEFGSSQNTPIFLATNSYQPDFEFCIHETVHIALLQAQTTTGSVIWIYNENDEMVNFWVFASDGISYGSTYEKNGIAVGPGQRQGLLFQFNETGNYRVMSTVFNDDLGNSPYLTFQKEDILFTINVNEGADCPAEPLDISSFTFTPGMGGKDISESEVVNDIVVQFEGTCQNNKGLFLLLQASMSISIVLHSAIVIPPGSGTGAKPASFRVDGQLFSIDRVMKTVEAGTGMSWTLVSNREMIHPFHIHVNPFQVIDIESTWTEPLVDQNVSVVDIIRDTNLVPPKQWRDTVFVPPKGTVKIYQRFGGGTSFAGKTVFHCHFLDHEDQGMMQGMIIADPIVDDGTTATDGDSSTSAPTEVTGDSSSTNDPTQSTASAASTSVPTESTSNGDGSSATRFGSTCSAVLVGLALGWCEIV